MNRNLAIIRRLIVLLALAAIFTLSVGLIIVPDAVAIEAFHAQTYVIPLTATPQPSATATPQPTSGIEILGAHFSVGDVVIAAVITATLGLIGVVLAAYINGKFLLKSKEVEQQKQGKETLDKTISPDKFPPKIVRAYRNALRKDPSVAYIQILNMPYKIDVAKVYVPVPLDDEVTLPFKLDPAALTAQEQHDPNELLSVQQRLLEHRFNTASSVDDAIDNSDRRCLILSDIGIGKTILLKHLALKHASWPTVFTRFRQILPPPPKVPLPKQVGNQRSRPQKLPIYVELNAFAKSTYASSNDLLGFIAREWEFRYRFPKDTVVPYLEKKLSDGQAILLLNALDESWVGMTSNDAEETYTRVIKTINRLTTRYHESPIIVTARKSSYQRHQGSEYQLDGFTAWEILDFRPKDIAQFITNWYATRTSSQRTQDAAFVLKAKIERNPRIEALTAKPFLLSLLLIKEKQLDPPIRPAQLYKECVDMFLSKWEIEHGVTYHHVLKPEEFKPEDKKRVLGEVAWYFHDKKLYYFSKVDLLEVLEDSLPKVNLKAEQKEQVLEVFVVEHGLLKEQVQGENGSYSFLCLSLQEHFAAQHVVEHNDLEDTLLSHRGDPWWEEVILLYTVFIADASTLLKKLGDVLEPSHQDDIFYTDLVFAGRCYAAHPDVEQALRSKILLQLFQALINTPYLLTQDRIVHVLTEFGEDAVHIELQGLLLSQQLDPSIQNRIKNALGELGERSVPLGLLPLLSDEHIDQQVHSQIANTLSELSKRSAVFSLKNVLFQAFAKLGMHSPDSDLRHLLSNERIDFKVRVRITNFIGVLGEQSVASELLWILNQENVDSQVRASIAVVLGKLREQSIERKLLDQLSSPNLNPHVGWSIARALGMLAARDNLIITEMQQLLAKRNLHPHVRWNIILILDKLGVSSNSIATEKQQLLTNEKVELYLRKSVATTGTPNRRFVVPDLLDQLNKVQLPQDERMRIANVIEQLANDKSSAEKLAELLQGSDISDSIYNALWAVSRRAGVRVITDMQTGKLKVIH